MDEKLISDENKNLNISNSKENDYQNMKIIKFKDK